MFLSGLSTGGIDMAVVHGQERTAILPRTIQESRDQASPDPPAADFAGGSRRWVRRRTKVRQAPTNKENPVKSAVPKGQKNEGKNPLAYTLPR